MRRIARSVANHGAILGLGLLAIRSSTRVRAVGAVGVLALWARSYLRYRRRGQRRTAVEYDKLRTAEWSTFARHYNERVPTIEEEFDMWGEYHQYRHEMRYDLVAAEVRRHLPPGGRVLDLGCGSALVADRIRDLDATYVGIDFGGHHIEFAASKYADLAGSIALRTEFAQGQGEALSFRDESFDVVVMSEVIEHLMRPEDAVWEVARVLKMGGVKIMTTNNASELPLRSPMLNPGAWLEKGLGFRWPGLISCRPWIWPEPMHATILPEGVDEVFLPHTHHIVGETAELYAAAGMDVLGVSTFEFPPGQSVTARTLERWGPTGRTVVDAIEAVATRTPFIRRLGAHMLMVVQRRRPLPSQTVPPGLWRGPFSDV